MHDIDFFTPILNPPACAIMGIGRIRERAVPVGGKLEIRPIVTLSLAFDHRVTDGAPAAAFLSQIKAALEAPENLLAL
jgi:pyruvate dehydrogenase E2 component (dihydrolipoamide acetyltransferase)